MQVIPVIDLMHGQVVHARMGQRNLYQPIQSQLCSTSQPLDIVAALMELYPFKRIYIADLDAIQKLDSSYQTNHAVIKSITQVFPRLEIWLDAGISCNVELDYWSKLPCTLVLGSENFSSIGNFLSSIPNINSPFVLSLDFMQHGYHGPIELLENTNHWPKDVIVMTLPNVGANQGINSALLSQLAEQANGFNLYAAGGVRHLEDLLELNPIHIHGALIASALHNKQITRHDLFHIHGNLP